MSTKIRTQIEMTSLDEDLHLFDEDYWDFFLPADELEVDCEYFFDIVDTDIRETTKLDYIKYITLLALAGVLVGSLVISLLIFTGRFETDINYTQMQGVEAMNSSKKAIVSYVNGKECSSEDIIDASILLNNYFNILGSKSNYKELNAFCVNGSSYAEKYNSFITEIKEIYDSNDCYARLFSEFGSFCRLNRITKLVEKDGSYYCYFIIDMPSDKDIYEYTYLYAYNFNKHFMAQSITEGAVVRYLFDMVTVSPIPSSPQEICLELVRDDSGDFLIKADTEISLACIRGYTEAIEHITDILGRNSVLN